MKLSALLIRTTTLALLLFANVTRLDGCAKCVMCMFPGTMYEVNAPWRIFAKDDDVDIPHDSRKVTFAETFMIVEYFDKFESVHKVKYTCKENKGDNKFWALKRLANGGDAGRYTCIQFLFRATNVVQLKIADSSSSDSSDICDDRRLKLVEAPLIYYGAADYWKEDRNKNLEYNECPLKGGFVVTWNDKDGNPQCDSVSQTTKLESECSKGEGLSFQTLGDHCDPPPLKHINLTHMHFCMADWEDGFYTYMLLYNYYGDTDFPCMRYPTNHGDDFNAVLFLDGACRTEADVIHIENALTLNLRRKVANDICADLSPDCEGLAMNKCGDAETRVCRDTCSLCPRRTRPWEELEFSPFLQGEWRRDTELLGEELITIDAKTMNIPSRGTFRHMGQTTCMAGRQLKNKDQSKEIWRDEGNEDVLLLSTYDNGCTPRITNIGLYNRSDSVVSFRIGNSLPAKIVENMGSKVNDERYLEFASSTWNKVCSSTSQIVDIKPLKDRYIAHIMDWYNMVRTGDDAPTVPCKIPETSPGEWTTLRIGTMSAENFDGKCAVQMEPHLETDHTFTMNFKNCTLKKKGNNRKVFNREFMMEFSCLGIAQDNYYDPACVFTKTKPNDIINHDYVSWIFRSYQDTIYMDYVGTCAHWTNQHLDLKQRQAIADFQFERYSGTVQIRVEIFVLLISLISYLVSSLE